MNSSKLTFFQESLICWYSKNGRKFPWRTKKATDYEIIISEILLQRTLASTVAKFLPTFINKYPSWHKLANTAEKEIQETLKPVGLYNQKGTGLYKLAKIIESNNGLFPDKHDEIRKLPLFGNYITNAYELLILNKNTPLLDGNMTRLLTRFFRKKKTSPASTLNKIAYKVVNTKNSIILNWAILDYASIVCKIRNPACNECILNNRCSYYLTHPK